MSEQVRIGELAEKMVRLMGYEVKDTDHPQGEIEIIYSGLRPGEKLYEELLIGNDPKGTEHPRIMKANEIFMEWEQVSALLDELDRACHIFDCERVRELLLKAPTGFSPSSDMVDLVWQQSIEAVQLPDASARQDSMSKVTRITGASRQN